jgi:hypothetical protein
MQEMHVLTLQNGITVILVLFNVSFVRFMDFSITEFVMNQYVYILIIYEIVNQIYKYMSTGVNHG